MKTKITDKTWRIITQKPKKSYLQITKIKTNYSTPFRKMTATAFLFVLVILGGCSSPAKKLQNQAEKLGLETTIILSGDRTIKSYHPAKKHGADIDKQENEITFVYIEGDGRPWSKRLGPNDDPNTRQSIILPLMTKTKSHGIYLSRPCYGFETMPEKCGPQWWTSHRYSKNVVDDLNAALTELKKELIIKKIVMVGHSGGGTLAMLMSQYRDDVAAVITLAGNLDHKAWTDFFNYLPLVGSLNPVEEPLLPPSIIRWHFVGKKDKVMPIAISRAAVKKDSQAKLIELNNFDHSCCWQNIWSNIVVDIEKAIRGRNQ